MNSVSIPNPSVAQMQIYRVEIRPQAGFINEQENLPAIRQLGSGVTACQKVRLFFLQGPLTPAALQQISRELLVDPVTETFDVVTIDTHQAPTADHVIEVTLLPGVTDPLAENLVRAAHLLGVTQLERAATGQCYWLAGTASAAELQKIATGVFANPVIQRFVIDERISAPFVPTQAADATVEKIAVRNADDAGLVAISQERRLALDLAEMQAIRRYYQQEAREPTDVELETLAQTWSEHCVHKTFRAQITCRTPDGQPSEIINGLLRTYIRGATERINKPWVRSAFVDNAGVIAFDDDWDLAFKVETHNHPSALEPFGGAHTGVGGVVRDILGISARPIANTDVLCFGLPDLPAAELPKGVLHPQRIAAGVTHGVEDYGNKMGIPTVNGAIFYHRGYTSNPLVFCGCLGLLPRNSHPTAAQPGDLIIVLGGRTGRDGIRGATFSSMEMDQTTSTIAGSAVQIGHPIQEKQVLEVVLKARDARLYTAITDCGAGGLASAVGEMGSQLGAEVDLALAPLKYPGLRPWEIWLSEAQERMVLAVNPTAWPALQAVCASQNVEAVSIGTFEASGRLRLHYGKDLVADLSMNFLHEGIPQRLLDAAIISPQQGRAREGPALPSQPAKEGSNLTPALLALLAHPNIRSKEDIIRRYDHEVQGGTAVKPLVGVANHGPSDAAVIVPLGTVDNAPAADGKPVRGAALSVGLCPRYGEIDPYAMAWAAIDEAMRNAVCVGADPDQVALLDNFCWGKPTLPDRLGSLVQCVQGCYDAALAYGAPFISGKDSLNNEYLGADGRPHAIPGTLLISALGIVPDVNRTATMDLKQASNLLYLVGDTHAELGGSHYQDLPDAYVDPLAASAPQPVPNPLQRLRAIHQAIRQQLVQACHDCSEGGLGVAIAEMCLAGRLGATIDLQQVAGTAGSDDVRLFAESAGRFVIEVRPADAAAFVALFADVPLAQIGVVNDAILTPILQVQGVNGQLIVQADVSELERAWRGSLAPALDEAITNKILPAAAQRATTGRPATTKPRVLIMHANGTNRDRDAALACELAGATPEIVHINQLLGGERQLLDYQMVVLPGGFSYGDDLGAGVLWALDLHQRLGDDLTQFAATGRPLLGICNGFQALVKAGLLPSGHFQATNARTATLTNNAGGHFECRWVYLRPNPHSSCLFTQGLDELIYCPVAHGEGRFIGDGEQLWAAGNVALSYVDAAGDTPVYPLNPNGSMLNIAGLCNQAGNILGLMPHPEDHIFGWQHPRWHRRGAGGGMRYSGLRLFEQGVRQC